MASRTPLCHHLLLECCTLLPVQRGGGEDESRSGEMSPGEARVIRGPNLALAVFVNMVRLVVRERTPASSVRLFAMLEGTETGPC